MAARMVVLMAELMDELMVVTMVDLMVDKKAALTESCLVDMTAGRTAWWMVVMLVATLAGVMAV
jgi:hypothetical protein